MLHCPLLYRLPYSNDKNKCIGTHHITNGMLRRPLQFALLVFSLLSTTSCAFTTGGSVHHTNQISNTGNRHTSYTTSTSTIVLHLSSTKNDGDDIEDELKEDLLPSQVSSNLSPSTAPRQLDPLFSAVTKMDLQTQSAERISVPIWGELILDRSLFVLLPIAVFALGGILLSFYVLVNSSDTFVTAIVDTAMKQSIPTSSSLQESDSCRGLCSSQAQDLEGLRSYMNRLGGK